MRTSVWLIKSSAGWVAGRTCEPAVLCVRARVELTAGRERVVLGASAERARVEKLFVAVTEC